MQPRSLLLIISGSIAAYKSLELIRGLRARGVEVTAILTRGGAQFITPLAVSSLTGTKTYSDLFSLTDEVEMGHIELSRSADIILVAPASANIISQMAHGQCGDLATTALLATNKPVFIAPAMNHKMWEHPATQRNIAQLRADGITVLEPTEGDMACGEFGVGRMMEPEGIIEMILASDSPPYPPPQAVGVTSKRQASSSVISPPLADPSVISPPLAGGTKGGNAACPLAGKHAVVTSGPTHEPVDPVRYLGNHSSGKQGHAVAAALAAAGARVTLICGNVNLPTPEGVTLIRATTSDAMYEAAHAAMPADIFVGAAAVADWRVAHIAPHKIKKHGSRSKLTLELLPTKDILASIGAHKQRPALVVGFAAETENLEKHAEHKRQHKHADWIIGNNVAGGVFGADSNEVILFREGATESFPRMSKAAVAEAITTRMTEFFESREKKKPSRRKA